MANKQTQNIGQDIENAGRERNSLAQMEPQASYWREQHAHEPYVTKGERYDEYAPAYRAGYEGRALHAGQRFDEVESELRREWESTRGNSTLGWDKASKACRAAWDRADQFNTLSAQTDRQQR